MDGEKFDELWEKYAKEYKPSEAFVDWVYDHTDMLLERYWAWLKKFSLEPATQHNFNSYINSYNDMVERKE